MYQLYYPGDGCWVSDRWQFNGMRALILENSLLRVVVLVDKGSDIVEFRHKPKNVDFLLQMPDGIRNPKDDVPSAYGGNTFLDYFSGGWNEVLPNGGPSVNYQGAELGQHGEVSTVPWHYSIIEDSPEQVRVRLWVHAVKTPLSIEKTLTLKRGEAKLIIDGRVFNRAGEPIDCMWGQHIAFGQPFLTDGAVIDVPDCKFIVHEAMNGYEPRRFKPEATSPIDKVPSASDNDDLIDARIVPAANTEKSQEMAYLAELEDGWYAITNLERGVGFGLRFDHHLFKYLWYWQQLGNVAGGYPWWGRLHCTALEPWTSYPTSGLNDAIQNGTSLTLQAGETVHHRLIAVAYESVHRVQTITEDGTPHFHSS